MRPDLTAPIGTVCSGYTLFVSILKSSVMLGIYLQMPFFRVVVFFFWGVLGVEKKILTLMHVFAWQTSNVDTNLFYLVYIS